MLKSITFLVVVLAVANGQLLGGWKPLTVDGNNVIPDVVEKAANWALKEINRKGLESGADGSHVQLVSIKNVEYQIVSGTNYRFAMDTIYASDNKYYVYFFK